MLMPARQAKHRLEVFAAASIMLCDCAAVLFGVLCLDHACLFVLPNVAFLFRAFVPLMCCAGVPIPAFYARLTPVFLSCRQKESACGSFRFYSAHRAAGVVRSHVLLWSSAAVGSLERVRFLFRRRGNEGLAACRFFLIARHIGFAVFSAGSTLGLRAPNPRQRAIGSLDSPQLRQVGLSKTQNISKSRTA